MINACDEMCAMQMIRPLRVMLMVRLLWWVVGRLDVIKLSHKNIMR